MARELSVISGAVQRNTLTWGAARDWGCRRTRRGWCGGCCTLSTACSPWRTSGWSSTSRTMAGPSPVTTPPWPAAGSTRAPCRRPWSGQRSGSRPPRPPAPASPACRPRPSTARHPRRRRRPRQPAARRRRCRSRTRHVRAPEWRTTLLIASTAIRYVATSTAAGRSGGGSASRVTWTAVPPVRRWICAAIAPARPRSSSDDGRKP